MSRFVWIVFFMVVGCRSSTPSSPQSPVAAVSEPSGTVVSLPSTASAETEAQSKTIVKGAAVEGGQLESDGGDEAGEEDAFPPFRGLAGDRGRIELRLRWNDDGTDAELHLKELSDSGQGARSWALGPLQGDRGDQLNQVVRVTPCEAEPDTGYQLCIRYQADPLGSLREEPYWRECIVRPSGQGWTLRWRAP